MKVYLLASFCNISWVSTRIRISSVEGYEVSMFMPVHAPEGQSFMAPEKT